MSIASNNAGAPLFVKYRPGTRRRIAAAVDALVALLDEIDGDADFEEDDLREDDAPREDGGDDEPSLGAPGAAFLPDQRRWSQGEADDREAESELFEDGGDAEPALGATVATDQRVAWAIGGEDCEYDPGEESGCADMDAVQEQHGFGVEWAG